MKFAIPRIIRCLFGFCHVDDLVKSEAIFGDAHSIYIRCTRCGNRWRG